MLNSEQHGIERAMHTLCAALHNDGIDPAAAEIVLPHDAWWRLLSRLEQLHRGLMVFDGRGRQPDQFQYMGIVFRPKGKHIDKEFVKLRSMLQNARNILRAEGYLYADRIDQEFPEMKSK